MSDHLVWAEGPECDESCPGESSQWHDGYAWGTEKAEARLRRIEEAARDYFEDHDGDAHSDATWPCDGKCVQARALRAALEEKP